MFRTQSLLAIASFAWLCVNLNAGTGRGETAPPPNILVILVDDWGWWNAGWHDPSMLTPNMNALVSQGIELEHMHAYKFCSPSRSALLSGRLPYHVNQQNWAVWGWPAPAVPVEMSMLPKKLAKFGYSSFQTGKWHLGLAEDAFVPVSRGFNHSLGYLVGSEDHFSQEWSRYGAHAVDLWEDQAPAYGKNGTFGSFLYGNYTVERIRAAVSANTPFFGYVAFQSTHAPEQAPQYLIDRYPSDWVQGRRVFAGMTAGVDDAVGGIVETLHALNVWENTLIILSSDNGGPSDVNGASNANNYPLRGSKGDDFTGGVNVAAFVSGGVVPESARGTKSSHFLHLCDVYCTVIKQAGGSDEDCQDPVPGMPDTDSVDFWTAITTPDAPPPRPDILLSYSTTPPPNTTSLPNAALVRSDGIKYIQGAQSGSGCWWGPGYPNSTSHSPFHCPGCNNGCLFNLTVDPTEHNDISSQFPSLVAEMQARMHHLGASMYQTGANATLNPKAAIAAITKGFWVPWIHT